MYRSKWNCTLSLGSNIWTSFFVCLSIIQIAVPKKTKKASKGFQLEIKKKFTFRTQQSYDRGVTRGTKAFPFPWGSCKINQDSLSVFLWRILALQNVFIDEDNDENRGNSKSNYYIWGCLLFKDPLLLLDKKGKNVFSQLPRFFPLTTTLTHIIFVSFHSPIFGFGWNGIQEGESISNDSSSKADDQATKEGAESLRGLSFRLFRTTHLSFSSLSGGREEGGGQKGVRLECSVLHKNVFFSLLSNDLRHRLISTTKHVYRFCCWKEILTKS